MRIRPGFKAYVILIFVGIFFCSLLILDNYYSKQHENFANSFTILKSLVTDAEDVLVSNLRSEIQEILVNITLVQTETMVYSSVMLFFIFVFSCVLFILLIVRLTRPIHELIRATKNIKEGDYSVYIRPSGVREVRDLAKSFNEMSKELDNTQQKLLISQKQMIWKDLARILTHEIKNPLTPIQLTIQRIEEKYYNDRNKFDEIFPESLHLIYQEINNLQNLVASFSSFAKDINLKPTVFDPALAIQDIIKPYMEKYNVVLNLKENYRIKFDNTHFYQIITNIFQNAIESSEENASIFISLEKSHSYIVIKIRDQGAGIHGEDLARIFEPYFTKKSKGTGLGLALVKKLCDANQCYVRVKSMIGEGTVFELIIEDFNTVEESDM